MLAIADAQRLYALRFIDEAQALPTALPPAGDTAITRQCVEELSLYFDGKLRDFTVPLALDGTDFQRQAWGVLCRIPYGETRSYTQQADALRKPKAVRAVGNANRVNPVALLVPCHRVIGANGRLTGYAGGLMRKKWLINHENRHTCSM